MVLRLPNEAKVASSPSRILPFSSNPVNQAQVVTHSFACHMIWRPTLASLEHSRCRRCLLETAPTCWRVAEEGSLLKSIIDGLGSYGKGGGA